MDAPNATTGTTHFRLVTAMLVAFAGVFLAGFIEPPSNLFLFPLGALAFGALVLFAGARQDAGAPGGRWIPIIGASALLFTAGLIYGAGGFWWDYDLIDALYVGGVVAAALVYVTSSLIWLRASRRAPPWRPDGE